MVRSGSLTEMASVISPAEAWQPFEPKKRDDWNAARAAHLLRRAGFDPPWAAVQKAVQAGPQQAIQGLFADCHNEPNEQFFDELEQRAARGGSAESFAACWLRRLLETKAVLREKMVLFWHNFFGVGVQWLPQVGLLHELITLLRQHALGNLDELFVKAIHTPAVLLSQNAGENRRSRPNEGFAQFVLEQLTVGPGNFTDEDVRALARCFSGWFVVRGKLRLIEHERDPRPQILLGTEVRDSQDAVKLLAGRKETARNIVRRLYRWLVSEVEQQADELVEPLVDRFHGRRDIGWLVATILGSRLFFSQQAVRRRVKSPVELAVGLARACEVIVPTVQLARDLVQAGQDLCQPPTTAGWPGGPYWLNPAQMLARQRLLAAMLAVKGPYDGRINPRQLAQRYGHPALEDAGHFFAKLLLPEKESGQIVQAIMPQLVPAASDDDRVRMFLARLVMMPEFQLC